MSTPVTVITPCFNVEEYVEESVRSVLNQSFCDFEFILIDDGSSDATLERARKAIGNDPRAKILTIPHSGVSAARNAGLNAARGEWVAFLDSDDVWHPEFLKEHFTIHQKADPKCVGSFAWSQFVDRTGAKELKKHRPAPGRYGLYEIAAGRRPAAGNGSSLFIRKQAILDAGKFDESLVSGNDLEMWTRLLASHPGSYFQCVPKILLKYRVRPGSISHLLVRERTLSMAIILARNVKSLPAPQKARILVQFSAYAQRTGDYRLALDWARQAASLDATALLGNREGFLTALLLAGGANIVRFLRNRVYRPFKTTLFG